MLIKDMLKLIPKKDQRRAGIYLSNLRRWAAEIAGEVGGFAPADIENVLTILIDQIGLKSFDVRTPLTSLFEKIK